MAPALDPRTFEGQPMEEHDVRERAEDLCVALVAGDIGRATEDFSKELRQHLGEVLGQTRWNDRVGWTTLIEASHLSKTAKAVQGGDAEGEADGGGEEAS